MRSDDKSGLTHCPERSDLLLLRAGELDGAQAEAIERHLSECRACSREAEALGRLTGQLSSLSGEGSPRAASACPQASELAAYADGSLAEGMTGALEAHLARCAACLNEVADLRRLSEVGEREETDAAVGDGPEGAVRAVLRRLEEDENTAVIRWAGRTLELVRDFAGACGEAAAGIAAPTPAAAAARAQGPDVSLRWAGPGGSEIVAQVRQEKGRPTITGRLSPAGVPASRISVVLLSATGRRGPESLDDAGRFGPWPVEAGDNTLRFTGLPDGPGHRIELRVNVVVDERRQD